jgi:hypothetical protein
MNEPKFRDVVAFDEEHGTSFVADLSRICGYHARGGYGVGVSSQFRTDWAVGSLKYALQQTLRYVGFGYESALVFKELGAKVAEMLEFMEKAP